MLVQLAWPCLALDSTLLIQRIINNTHALSNQAGYNPAQRYAGLWHWPEQDHDAMTIYSELNLKLPFERLHLQWVKPPGIGFHRDRNRHLSATCVMTDPHPTDFRVNGVVTQITMRTGYWYLFDHWVEHAVLNLQQDRFAICIDLTGLYPDFAAAATAWPLRSS
jgi:hypothetical protein